MFRPYAPTATKALRSSRRPRPFEWFESLTTNGLQGLPSAEAAQWRRNESLKCYT